MSGLNEAKNLYTQNTSSTGMVYSLLICICLIKKKETGVRGEIFGSGCLYDLGKVRAVSRVYTSFYNQITLLFSNLLVDSSEFFHLISTTPPTLWEKQPTVS